VAGYQLLGYIGAISCFVFSLAGAYNTGAIGVIKLEEDFFAFIDEYQGDSADKYIAAMDEDELGTALANFLTFYAFDVLMLTVGIFWHIMFTLGMGMTACLIILIRMLQLDGLILKSDWNNTNVTDVDLFKGWKLFMYGTIVGLVNWLISSGLSVNGVTILQMIGFTGQYKTSKTKTEKCTYSMQSGTNC
jgi:hypothetical protein